MTLDLKTGSMKSSPSRSLMSNGRSRLGRKLTQYWDQIPSFGCLILSVTRYHLRTVYPHWKHFELKDALNSGLVKILPCHRWRFFPFPLVVNERFLRLAKANIDDPLAFPLIDKYGWREFIEQTLAGRLKSAEPDFRTRGK